MNLRTLLADLPIPILQAPMVGATTAGIALAVSRAGGMGWLAAGAMAAADIEAEVAALKAALDAPFGVNLLMAPKAAPERWEVDAALARLAPWYEELGAARPALPNQYAPDFDSQLEAVIRSAPPVASFTFDILTRDQVDALHGAGTLVIGTAATVAEARAWAQAGADGVCAQGFEAGGHRGNFLAGIEGSLVGTMALVTTIREAVDLPVIAAGGIMDGRGVAAALALGADAVQMGTAFLLADEAATGATWRGALAAAADDPTRLTRAFTGRYARGVENRFMREMHDVQEDVPAYPVQNRLTQPLRAAADRAGDPEMMSLWAGQGVKLARPGPAGELIRRWWDEARTAGDAVVRRTRGEEGP
ncbi:2-nitropropane dioxygenase-like protein [Phenylobacterium zucineum HLK1]|uniref:Nitronate monooxygenase n=1 Tax=Phenylobacterium zucineum (strain HLK1) TaxID=450851 RepID=B4RHE6_PHEZH|nr:nitronate monooxygenase [Phenylobacterium zucineum]ACG77406.1 2-nitropropane dioxygenase-like protein [Phenylobacterium zucineum HLK1]